MTLWQDIVSIGAILCLVYAVIVAMFLGWALFIKRRTLFAESTARYSDQIARVEQKLKERK